MHSFAKLLKYKYLVIGNNDIKLPSGAIFAMQQVLLGGISVAVPLTSERGSGHNPSQSIRRAHNLSEYFESYIENPYNVNKIQETLSSRSRNQTCMFLRLFLAMTK